MAEPTPFQRTLQHAMELWFEPEIKRRQDAGLIPKPYSLKAAQVIIHVDSRPNEVRLNEEVVIMGEAKVKEGVNTAIGAYLSLNEIDGIEKWYLPESEDPNCGHLTIVILAGNWYCAFDFRYNKAQSRALLVAAEEFLSIASYALETNMLRATADNLFSAAELAAKAYVITTPLPGASTSNKHGFVHSQFNLLGRHGNIDSDQRKAFNILSSMRAAARYMQGEFTATSDDLSRLKSQITDLVSAVRSRSS